MTASTHGIFLRLEAYSLKAAARKRCGNAVRGVISEAMRIPGYCNHVPDHQLPMILYGVSPMSLLEELAARSVISKSSYFHKASGKVLLRRSRSDCTVMVSGVISVPDDWSASEERWSQFIHHCILWLIERFGADRLRSVVQHLDEKCPHIHFFLMPRAGEGIGAVHPGQQAIRHLSSIATPLQRDGAYKAAMKRLLDDFHSEVGQKFGLVRKHINAKRMARRQMNIWKWYRDVERRNTSRQELVLSKNQLTSDCDSTADLQPVDHELTETLVISMPGSPEYCVAPTDYRISSERAVDMTGSAFMARKKTVTDCISPDQLHLPDREFDFEWVRPANRQ